MWEVIRCDFCYESYEAKRSFASRADCILNYKACCLVFSSFRIALREVFSFSMHDGEIQNHLENSLLNIKYFKSSNQA